MKVVNLKTDKYDEYIGRPSIAGNPFTIGIHGAREEVIQKYKVYFNYKIETDKEFRRYILSLRGKTLGCFCKPLACHGDIIIDWLKNNDKK